MSLSVLPNELIQLIAEHLVFDCDVNALSKTDRRLYVLLNRYSYLVNISRFGSSALPWLCHHGCTPLVRMMLDEGAPLDVFGDQDLHPMCLAASEGHADVVETFLQRGVDPNADIRRCTHELCTHEFHTEARPVAMAAPHESVLRVMSAYGTDLSNPELLCRATEGSSLAAVKFLAALTADLEDATATGWTPLESAVHRGNLETTEFPIGAGSDPNRGYIRGMTPIVSAAVGGHLDIARVLIAHGANVELTAPTSPRGRHLLYPLGNAAERGHVAVVELFLKHIDITAGGENRVALLAVAAACGFGDLVKQILLGGCDPDARCINPSIFQLGKDRTALSWAASRGHTEIVEVLLQYGADPNGVQDTEPQQQPLSDAVAKGHERIVQLLLDKGADPNQRLSPSLRIGKRPLSQAVSYPSIFQMLLCYGADPFRVEHTAEMPVLTAIKSGNVAAIQILLDNGVSLSAPMLSGKLLDIALCAAQGGGEMLEFLFKRVNILEGLDEDIVKRVLKKAADEGYATAIAYFLNERDFGSDRKLLHDLFAEAALGVAAAESDEEGAAATLDVLLGYGVNINAVEKYTKEPCLLSAINMSGPAAVRALLERGADPLAGRFGALHFEGAIMGVDLWTTEYVRALLHALDARGTPLGECGGALSAAEEQADEKGNHYIKRLLQNYYWRKRYPVP